MTEKIGNILNQFLHELGIDKPIKRYEALYIWPKVVGNRISEVTEPKYISNGKIFVEVKNSTWRNEIIFYKAQIIDKMNRELGCQFVVDIILI